MPNANALTTTAAVKPARRSGACLNTVMDSVSCFLWWNYLWLTDDSVWIFLVRRRVDHQQTCRCIAGDGENMLFVGRKKATIAGDHLPTFAIDFDISGAFK